MVQETENRGGGVGKESVVVSDDDVAWAQAIVSPILRGCQIPVHSANDLRHEAVIGLLEAAERFDTSDRTAFRTFASTRVRGAVVDALRRWSRQAYGYHRRKKRAEDVLSLDASLEDRETGDRKTLHDRVADGFDVDRFLDVLSLGEALDTLTPGNREMIVWYFGDGVPMKTIGRRIGVTESRVSQQMSKALAQLRVAFGVDAPRRRLPLQIKNRE